MDLQDRRHIFFLHKTLCLSGVCLYLGVEIVTNQTSSKGSLRWTSILCRVGVRVELAIRLFAAWTKPGAEAMGYDHEN